MKRVIKCADAQIPALYNLDDLSVKDAISIIQNSLPTAKYIQVSYYDPFAREVTSTAFKRTGNAWSQVTGKGEQLMNQRHVNEKNLSHIPDNHVLKEFVYTLQHFACRYISIK